MAEKFEKTYISVNEFIESWEKELYELNYLDYFIFLLINKLGFQIEHDEKVHAKLLLIDDTELLIGSANLVGTSMIRNHEVALCTNHPKTVRDATNYFNDLINEIFSKRFDKVEKNTYFKIGHQPFATISPDITTKTASFTAIFELCAPFSEKSVGTRILSGLNIKFSLEQSFII